MSICDVSCLHIMDSHSELSLLRENQFHFIWSQGWWLLCHYAGSLSPAFLILQHFFFLLCIWWLFLGNLVNCYLGGFFTIKAKDEYYRLDQRSRLMFSTVISHTLQFSAINGVRLMVRSTDVSTHAWWLYRPMLTKAKGKERKIQEKLYKLS